MWSWKQPVASRDDLCIHTDEGGQQPQHVDEDTSADHAADLSQGTNIRSVMSSQRETDNFDSDEE